MDGFSKQQVIDQLALLFKTTEYEIRSRLDRSSFVVKKGIDFATAEKYKAKLEQYGCAVDIHPESNPQAIIVPAAAPQVPTIPQAFTNAGPSLSLPSHPIEQRETLEQSGFGFDTVQAKSPLIKKRSYKVRFVMGRNYQKMAPNSFKFYGKGSVEIDSERVKVSGKRHRLFWFGAREEHEFRYANIYNVRSNGKFVLFEVLSENTKLPIQVGFNALEIQAAFEIVNLLPQQQTEAFVNEQAELNDFKQRLDHLSPGAPITPIIVALNVAVFVAMALGGAGFWIAKPSVAINWGSNFGPMTLDGQWWRLFTATFIHFGIIHLLFNMLALYQTGRMVERMFGSFRYLMLYVFSGLIASSASLLWNPTVNSAGASGAIFGVYGGLLVFMLNPKNEVPRSVMNEHRNSTLAFIAYCLFNGFTHSGIDNGAHVGGLLGGMIMGYLLARPINASLRFESDKKQLITAGVIGLLILSFSGFQLLNPSEDRKQELVFTQGLNLFIAQEGKVLEDTQRLFPKQKTIGSDQASSIADKMEKDILPQWERFYQLISKAKLRNDSRKFPLQQTLLVYLNDRKRSCVLIIEGIRKDDKQMILQAGELLKDADIQVQNMKKLKI